MNPAATQPATEAPVSADPDIVIKATGLVKRYGRVVALDHADFELRAGEILAVIGKGVRVN